MKESGKAITWKVWASILGMMEENMKENIRMIKNMAMEFINGQMAEYIQATGTKESNMV